MRSRSADSRLPRAFGWLDRTPIEIAVGLAAAGLLAVNAFGVTIPGAAVLAVLMALAVPGGGVLAVALTIFVLPPMRVGGPVFDMRPDEVLAVGVILGYGLRLVLGSARPRTRLWKASGALVAIMVISLAVRYGLRWETPVLKAFYPTAKMAVRLALMGTVVWMSWRSEKSKHALRVALLIGGLFAAAVAIGQYYIPVVGEFVRNTFPAAKGEAARVFYYRRSFGAFEGNPNHLGAAMLLLSIVALSWAESARATWLKIACFAGGLVYLVAMVHSGSRGALFILAVITVGYALRRHWLAVSGSVLAGIYMLVAPNALKDRLPQLFLFGKGTVKLGTSASGKIAMLDPTYASSHGTIVTPVDSTYLDLLYNYGPIALVVFLVLVFLIAMYVMRGSLKDDSAGGARAAAWVLAAMLLLGLNGPFFSVSRVAELGWIVFGLGIAIAVRSREKAYGSRKVGVCTSVHTPADPRIIYREGSALARSFDVHLYTFAREDRLPTRDMPGVHVEHCGPAPRRRITRAFRAGDLIQQALSDGASTIMVHDPEMLPWLVALAREPGVVTVYDMHEDYTSMVLSKPWIPAKLRRAVASMVTLGERMLLPGVHLLVVADEYLASRFASRHPLVVRNYPPSGLFAAGVPAGQRGPGLVYVGGVTVERGAQAMVSALALVRERVPATTLVVVGRVPHGDAEQLAASAWGVSFVGEVDYASVGSYIAEARVGLSLLQDTPKHRHNVPSKLFDYMACGTPFVASDLLNVREATSDAGGLFTDPADAESTAEAIIRLLTDDELATRLGSAGLAAARGRFSFEPEGARLVNAIEALLTERSR